MDALLESLLESVNFLLGVVDGQLRNKAEAATAVTRAELERRLADVIGAAPEALNQLEEFAEALGNDPNFAQTMLAKFAEKADKASVYTIAQADGKFLLKNGQAADSAKLGGQLPASFATAAAVTALESKVADGFSRLAEAFNNGANQINGVAK
ncbi:hypothetical protein ACRCP3_26980 [Pseudomonas aeruginosa]|uniref:hypothetical protein n=1 Tax=Pseudomonas aeruginosa TaxID=287 RepID=UPI001A1E72E8|nr:hypothetical protein [Pseudomonas aeruginosa]MBH9149115.1 hypothetical protein [Pseudomonas aeruginosa]WAJ88565.1 hypothetical protein PAC13_35070 [Pseudomonas aeruginosa]